MQFDMELIAADSPSAYPSDMNPKPLFLMIVLMSEKSRLIMLLILNAY